MESATSVVGSPIENPEMIVFDVNSLGERFRALTDKRHRRGIRYRLDLLLVLLVLAKLGWQTRAIDRIDQPFGYQFGFLSRSMYTQSACRIGCFL